MSSTNRAAERQPDDFYATPGWAVEAILPHLRSGLVVSDPFAGKGAILDVAKASGKWIVTNGIELDTERADVCAEHHAVRTGDAFGERDWRVDGQTVLTNPPYVHAMKSVMRALEEIGRDGEAAFLLRLGWLASADRAAFHKKHPSDIYVLSRRPSFCVAIACKVTEKHKGCGWKLTQELEAPRPTHCPSCGITGLTFTTSDSSDYGWYCWGSGRGNRWWII